MEITPMIPAGRQIIERYGNGRFQITGVAHQGPVLVRADLVLPWQLAEPAGIADAPPDSLAPILDADRVSLLLVGCGRRAVALPPAWLAFLRARRIGFELMDTGAACRTYNVLLSEERRVAAALIAVE